MTLMNETQCFLFIDQTKVIQGFANSNSSINKSKICLFRALKARIAPIFLRTPRNTPQAPLFIDLMESSSDSKNIDG